MNTLEWEDVTALVRKIGFDPAIVSHVVLDPFEATVYTYARDAAGKYFVEQDPQSPEFDTMALRAHTFPYVQLPSQEVPLRTLDEIIATTPSVE